MRDQDSGDQRDSAQDKNAAAASRAATITLPKNIRITTTEYGDLRLQSIVLRNIPNLVDLSKQEISTRTFVVRFICELLVSPGLDEGNVVSWSDKLLERVAAA